MENFNERIENIIRENMIDSTIEIHDTSEFVCDLGYDSIHFMGLFYSLEEEFDIEIINSDKNYMFFSVISVGDLKEIMNVLCPN